MELFSLSQDKQLRIHNAPPDVRGGVCVAACNFWLADCRQQASATAAERIRRLKKAWRGIMAHQQQYGVDRGFLGRSLAREVSGRRMGLDFADQTVVMRSAIGMAGIRQRLAADISFPGKAATWTLDFGSGGRHAIAGFCGLTYIRSNVRQFEMHVFDPNIGEYVGTLQELDVILADLLLRFPVYQTVTNVYRTSEG